MNLLSLFVFYLRLTSQLRHNDLSELRGEKQTTPRHFHKLAVNSAMN